MTAHTIFQKFLQRRDVLPGSHQSKASQRRHLCFALKPEQADKVAFEAQTIVHPKAQKPGRTQHMGDLSGAMGDGDK